MHWPCQLHKVSWGLYWNIIIICWRYNFTSFNYQNYCAKNKTSVLNWHACRTELSHHTETKKKKINKTMWNRHLLRLNFWLKYSFKIQTIWHRLRLVSRTWTQTWQQVLLELVCWINACNGKKWHQANEWYLGVVLPGCQVDFFCFVSKSLWWEIQW